MNCRLLFNTKEEALKYLGLKSIDDFKRTDDNMSFYSKRLEKKLQEYTLDSLEEFVSAYQGAVEQYYKENGLNDPDLGEDNTGGRRTRSEIRRILAVRLFLWAYIGQTFKGKDASLKIFKNLFPKKAFEIYCPEAGCQDEIDVCFTVLMTWGIVAPNKAKTSDYEVTDQKNRVGIDRNQLMLELLYSIKEEMPAVGMFKAGSLPSVDHAITEIKHYIKHGVYPSSVQYWVILQQIAASCVMSASPDQITNMGLQSYSLPLSGIWRDNAQGSEKRFWVFPANYQFAFCFEEDLRGDWQLLPYSFFVMTTDMDSPDYENDYFVWMDPESTLKTLRKGGSGIAEGLVCYTRFTMQEREDGSIDSIELRPMKPQLPISTPWSRFDRMSADDPFYTRAQEVITRSRIREEGYNSLINIVNCLVAIDSKYLYIYDYPISGKTFRLCEDKEDPHPETFVYELYSEEKEKEKKKIDQPHRLTLAELIKENYSVYMFPRNLKAWKKRKELIDPDTLARLSRSVEEVNIDSLVTVYHFGESKEQVIIYFNDFSVGISRKLFEDLELKFTGQKIPSPIV
ncbi:MAG: hypothetical protein K2K55_04575 [Duncaniella sp.]|nr:hypothetical protein [Duncaniella sp.]